MTPTDTPPKADGAIEAARKLEIIKRVLKMASEDMRPAEPHWHVDFLTNAVFKIEEVQELYKAHPQKPQGVAGGEVAETCRAIVEKVCSKWKGCIEMGKDAQLDKLIRAETHAYGEIKQYIEAAQQPQKAGDTPDDGGFKKAVKEWAIKHRNALTYHPDLDSGLDERKISQRSGGYAAYKSMLNFIKEYEALTPTKQESPEEQCSTCPYEGYYKPCPGCVHPDKPKQEAGREVEEAVKMAELMAQYHKDAALHLSDSKEAHNFHLGQAQFFETLIRAAKGEVT